MKKTKKNGEIRLVPTEAAVDRASKYGCCIAATTASRWFVGILSVTVLIVVAVVVILDYNNNVAYSSLQRYFLQSADGNIGGMTNLDSAGRTIGWNLFFLGGLTTSNAMASMGIYGPLTDPLGIGPSYLPLCGLPSIYVCTSYGLITSTSPTGYSLSNFIATIRANPATYYLNITSPTGTSVIIRLGISAGH